MIRPLLFSLCLTLAAATFAADAPNTLTPEEKAGGWKLLFDGSSPAGWVAIGKDSFPSFGWGAKDGELRLEKVDGKTPHQDIVTKESFSDFELTWEWKISEGGNSGVKYNLPDPKKGVGCEYQLIDDAKHADASKHDGTRKTAGLYDVIARSGDDMVKPAGEWNFSRIVVKGNHVEHFLNGKQTVAYDFGSDDLKRRIAESKFNKTPGWGVKTSSPILLQDHGDEVAFRNIKIKAGK
jgi:hypothetical protein